jgi:hypothetical protein
MLAGGTALTANPPRPEGARTYYVQVSGADGSNGDARNPFRSIQHAIDRAAPGDTIIVGDGTFSDVTADTPCVKTASAPSRPVVCVWHGGTSGAPLTIRAEHKWSAHIDGRGVATEGFRFVQDAGYVSIEQFDVSGLANAAQSASAFELYAGGHDVRLAENRIHDIGEMCSDVINGQTGIFVEQPRVRIERNVIYNVGRRLAGEDGCHSHFQATRDHGIYVDGKGRGPGIPGASDILIANNLFFGRTGGWGIQVYPGAVGRLRIVNNTFALTNPRQTGVILIGASTTDSEIVNNLFATTTSAAINFYTSSHQHLTVANNLSSTTLSTAKPTGVLFFDNIDHADPQVRPADFRPAPTSPALAHGRWVEGVETDITGRSRPRTTTWDIGAVEQLPTRQ